MVKVSFGILKKEVRVWLGCSCSSLMVRYYCLKMMQNGGSNINRTTIFITLLFICSTMSFAVGGKQIFSAFSREKRGRIAFICNNIRHSSSFLSTQCSTSHCMVNNINTNNKQRILTSLYTTTTTDDDEKSYNNFNNMNTNNKSRMINTTTSISDDEKYDWNTLLPFEQHTHNSIKISIDEDVSNNGSEDAYDVSTFQSKLQATLETAQELHKSAMWIDVDISRSNLISQAAKLGFQYHHASGGKATLCKWLIKDQSSRIPEYATHQVGVGACVINPVKDEILVVREARNNYRPWKIPGGLAELGEHLDEAAVREVYEETGIECSFNNVLAMRHTHGMQVSIVSSYGI